MHTANPMEEPAGLNVLFWCHSLYHGDHRGLHDSLLANLAGCCLHNSSSTHFLVLSLRL